jgi:uncharacterized low-complexity protein
MSQKLCKPLALAIGAALIGAAGSASAAPAFALVDIGGGYMIAAGGEGKCGEGKCGMDKMDTDKDGSISRAEHTAHADAMFTAADADKDGKVTQAEMDAHHKGMEGKGKEGSCGGDKGKEGSCGGTA